MVNVILPILVGVVLTVLYVGWQIFFKHKNYKKFIKINKILTLLGIMTGMFIGVIIILYVVLKFLGLVLFELESSELESASIIGALVIFFRSFEEFDHLRKEF